MKRTLILMAFFISACGGQVSALSQNTDTEYRTPQPTATQSPVPTATIEYKATANAAETQAAIAQATADESRRINAVITAEYESRVQEQLQMTAAMDARTHEASVWTATAALTSIPLTTTAQVDNKTAVAAANTMTTAKLTATAALPTQIVAAANAETQAQFAPVRYGIEIFALFGLGVFGLFGAWFMVWYWRQQDARDQARAHAQSPQGVAERDGFQPVQPVQPVQETIITVRQDLGDNNTRMDKYTVPCTRDQLLQVAENVLSHGWTLGINQWESAGTLFTRNTFGKLRTWLQVNRFAVSGGGGTLALSPEGRAFLESFLNTSNIPTEYQFGEVAQ